MGISVSLPPLSMGRLPHRVVMHVYGYTLQALGMAQSFAYGTNDSAMLQQRRLSSSLLVGTYKDCQSWVILSRMLRNRTFVWDVHWGRFIVPRSHPSTTGTSRRAHLFIRIHAGRFRYDR